MADLREASEDRISEIVHNVPSTEQHVAQQNFARGYIQALDDLLGLEEEAKGWGG